MIRIENECVGCETCLPFCSLEKVPRLYCDKCGQEVDRLFEVNGEQWCEDCIWDMFPEVDPYEDN